MLNRMSTEEREQKLAELVTMLAALTDLVRPSRMSSEGMQRMIVAYAEELVSFDMAIVRDAIREWPRANKSWPSLAELLEACGQRRREVQTRGDPVIATKLAELAERGWTAERIAQMGGDSPTWIAENIRSTSVDGLVTGLEKIASSGVTPPRRKPRNNANIDTPDNHAIALEIAAHPERFLQPLWLLGLYLDMCRRRADISRMIAIERSLISAAAPSVRDEIERMALQEGAA
jgi:hypothetical protein